MGAERMFGVDLQHNGNPPSTTEFDDDHELFKWLNERPQSDTTHIRILCVQLEKSTNPESIIPEFNVPLPQSVVESAIWKPEVYYNLTANPAGGAAGLIDEPFRFILQTPLDGGPFCSLAMSRKGQVIKGIYFFDDESLKPTTIAINDTSPSAWRSSGLQIVTLPHKFLRAHSVVISQRLARTIANVRKVEIALAAVDRTPADLSSLNRILHSCNLELVDIERRSRFEQSVVTAMETLFDKSGKVAFPWPPLSLQQAAVESRKFDFESLPHRIENARATITSLIQQRTEALNLELMQATHHIAEATLSDSRSMKTIAILTMVLLPGTAVASLFSMNLFNWSAADGDQIASKWLWIYFVVTIPLTGIILAMWWVWNRRSLQLTVQSSPRVDSGFRSFSDEEAGPSEAPTFVVDRQVTKAGDDS